MGQRAGLERQTDVPLKVIQSCLTLCDSSHGLYSPWNSPGQHAGVASLFLLQGIFLTQEWNPGLLHFRQILYQLSYQGSSKSSRAVLTSHSVSQKDSGVLDSTTSVPTLPPGCQLKP